jgi:gluconolactonase
LLISDIPNSRLMKFDETTNEFTVHKENVNYANGNTRDRQGRLITCEHSITRRVVRFEQDGKMTVRADSFEGKKLNAPNDVVVKSDGSIWFTDPLFGINGEWEGARAKPEQATTNVYRIARDGKLTAVITDIVNPNGLAFSPDEKKLYLVEWKGTPHRSNWSSDVGADGTCSNKVKLIDADGPLKAHLQNAKSEDYDGVKIFNATGKPIGFIRLPERCANVEFGGPKRNRLYMASCHSLYALYVESHGAV